MYLTYRTPGGEYSPLYHDMAQQTHVLIAGCTGSGKSVVINGIMHSLLLHSPVVNRFILIDLKMVELSDYRALPHTIMYADDVKSSIAALENALDICKLRYADMQKRHLKTYDGCNIYIVIDEMADLLTSAKRESIPLIQRLCQIGRAAKVHVIAATQHIPTIPTCIRCNFNSRVGLRTETKTDSRNIIGISGCEEFPDPVFAHKAIGVYKKGSAMESYNLPMIAQSEIDRVVHHWTNTKPKRHFFKH